MQDDTVSILFNVITIKGKNRSLKACYVMSSELAIILSLGFLSGDVTHGQTDIQPDD